MMLNKLSLNTIGLNRIGLNRIGKPSRGSSDRPYIDPEVLSALKAVCICYGKSNDDPDRAVVKNLVDPDNPFIISNAAFKLNSGFGEYEEDFTTWYNASGMLRTSSKVELIDGFKHNWVINKRSGESTINSFKVLIKGIPESGYLQYRYFESEDATKKSSIDIYEDGEYSLPNSTLNNLNDLVGFQLFSKIPPLDSQSFVGLTITQIPSFEGAFVTDGIDDLITSTKTVQEMGITKACTVISMIHHIDVPSDASFNNIRNSTAVSGRNGVYASGTTGIYGWSKDNVSGTSTTLINNILGDKNNYTNGGGGSAQVDNMKFSVQGFISDSGVISETSQVAWYWTVIANKVLTTDQINQVIAYYNLDRCVEPTVLYDVKRQGLSNDTPDSDWYLKDYSGNGYDMTLYNYAKNPESGINEGGGLQSDGVEDYGKVTGLPIYKDYTVVADREVISVSETGGILASKSETAAEGDAQGAFIFEYLAAPNAISTWSFYANNGAVATTDFTRSISYQSKYSYNGKTLTAGEAKDSDKLWIGIIRDGDSRLFNGAIYSLMTFPYSMSEFLIERQLKKHKLGTLYPDMVEWRPIIKSNSEYTITAFSGSTPMVIGSYYPINTPITFHVKPKGLVDEVVKLTINGKEMVFNKVSGTTYIYDYSSLPKSPQKIDITIDEYIRFEDIVQPYPAILSIPKPGGGNYTFGEKIPVGYKFNRSPLTNLLGEFYSITGFWLNDILILSGEEITVSKTMVCRTRATWIATNTNAPKCILSPSRLRIPNSSYKILGYIPDLSGNGNHGKINNSAYAGMSGANGYNENFTTWAKYPKVNVTDSRITLNGTTYNEYWIIYQRAPHKSFKVNISGIPTGGKLVYRNNQGNEVILSNGINTIPSVENTEYNVGFAIQDNSASLNWSNLVIEQIGEYEGAYCLDGVDDFISIPTTVGGKQVLMKVNQSNIDSCLYTQVEAGIGQDRITTALPNSLAYQGRWEIPNWSKVYIDAIENNYITNEQLYNITHIITAVSSNSVKTTTPIIGALRVGNSLSTFAQMSLYDFMLFDEISTDEEIATLNEYIGIEPKITIPDYYWDAYGKANNDANDIEGNHTRFNNKVDNSSDYQLVPYNFAWDLMSGYGGWEFPKFTDDVAWHISPNTSIEVVNRTNYSVTLRKLANTDYFYFQKAVSLIYRQVPFKVRTDKAIKVCWDLHYTPTGGTEQSLRLVEQLVQPNVDTMVTLTYKTEEELNDLNADLSTVFYIVYFDLYTMTENEEVTVTELPLYPNGLCFDGVDDYLLNRNIPVFTDFTVISKRIWLEENTSNKPFIIKGDTLYPDGIKNAFLFEYGKLSTYCFGQNNKYDESVVPSLISYATKQSYNGVVSLVKGSATDTIGLDIAHNTRMVFYKLMLYPKTLTNLEIMFLKNMFEKDEIIDLTNPIFIKE